jgi:hypothetical protein
MCNDRFENFNSDRDIPLASLEKKELLWPALASGTANWYSIRPTGTTLPG